MSKNKFRFLISLSPELTEKLEEWERQGTHGKSDFVEDVGRQFFGLSLQNTVMDPTKLREVAKHMRKVDNDVKGQIIKETEQVELDAKNKLDRSITSLHQAIYYIRDYDTGTYKRKEKLPIYSEVEMTTQNWINAVFPKEPFFLEITLEDALKELKKLEDTIQLSEKKKEQDET